MINLKKGDKSISIEVMDYEFPDLADLGGPVPQEVLDEYGVDYDYDSNWLCLKLSCENAGVIWEREDPFLLTWEMDTLLAWFRNLAESEDRDNISPMLFFIEPCFSLYQNEENGIIHLRFALSMELVPPAHPQGMEYYMDFDLTREEVADVTLGLASAMAKFPKR